MQVTSAYQVRCVYYYNSVLTNFKFDQLNLDNNISIRDRIELGVTPIPRTPISNSYLSFPGSSAPNIATKVHLDASDQCLPGLLCFLLQSPINNFKCDRVCD
jgi:hypothetical protein